MRADLLVQRSGFGQPACRGERQQLVVGLVFHRKIGKTGGQFEIGQSNVGSGRSISSCGSRSSENRAIEEFGAGQDCRHHLLDSQIEASTFSRPNS